MDYIVVTFHQVALYQLAAFPFALMYSYLCSLGHLPITLRHVYLLVGGIILAFVSMGPFALLLLTPALGSILLFHIVSWKSVHRWAFTLQMSWQTGCHIWLLYREYYLQEAMTTRLSIMISSLMLLTQKVTSLALDIHERQMTIIILDGSLMKHFCPQVAHNILIILSYFMFFPALLGGPLCSFETFQQQICKSHMPNGLWSIWLVIKGCALAVFLRILHALVYENINLQCTLMDCEQLNCIYIMWITAFLFKLTYYSHWILDHTLFHVAGFVTDVYHSVGFYTDFSDADIWTLETTCKISVFARTWNKSTARWLKRLVFQHCKTRPLLMTFVFSAWWHGFYPGQVFGFLCWAAMVKADYRVHNYLDTCQKTWYIQSLCKAFTWVQTQLIIAFIMMAVEMRSFAIVWALCTSSNSLFPILYCVSAMFL
ncbi:ghrelin O-acyltransferase [Spea bombifrons]|uniref:ghrelin O-acyltransferase n=1 Tax=Spea bombifrons TaxID=233779 RepID=UPI00234985E2|nr:ghrelin O-acyltransferase [Spea bombifrons]